MKTSLLASIYTFVTVFFIAVVIAFWKITKDDGFGFSSICQSIGVAYLFMSLTVFRPFLGLIFQGEHPLNPWGFTLSVLVFMAIVFAFVYILKALFSRSALLTDLWAKQRILRRVLQNRLSVSIAILVFLFIAILPFCIEMDFF